MRPTGGVTSDTRPAVWAGEPLEVTVDLLEATGSGTVSGADVTVALTTSSTTGRFDTAADGSFDGSVTSVTIPAGATYVDVYYRDTAAGMPMLTATAPALAAGTRQVKVFARSFAPGGEVAYYTARVGWCTVATANAQTQISAAKLAITSISRGQSMLPGWRVRPPCASEKEFTQTIRRCGMISR